MDSVTSFASRHRLKCRVDSDGTKIILGKFGHLYDYGNGSIGLMIVPNPPRKRYWSCVCITLLKNGFKIVQDGDGEGAAVFDPENPIQARLAIRVAGIKRTRQLSPAQREQRIAYLRIGSGKAHSGPGTRRKPRKVAKPCPRRSKVPSAVSPLLGDE